MARRYYEARHPAVAQLFAREVPRSAPLIEDMLGSLGHPNAFIDEASLLGLLSYHWPGNIRELRNIGQRALVESEGGPLSFDKVPFMNLQTPEPGGRLLSYNEARKEFDRQYYTALWFRFRGNLSQIAKAAGKQRVTVREALRELGLYVEPESTRDMASG